MTAITSPKQAYWDDLAEGDNLTGFDLSLSTTKIVEQVSGSQDFYPVHHDREFAHNAGHPDIFVNTGFTRAVLGRFLTDLTGTSGWVHSLTYQMRRMNRPGDTMKVRGKVTRKYVADDGTHRIDLDLWIENDREGVTTPASGTVELPSRQDLAR
jgi:acyl dehydratase